MIELSILKVEHETLRGAKKLKPYIKKSDICGIEWELGTEERALKTEENWQKLLQTDMSLDKFKKYNQKLFSDLPIKLREYMQKHREYLFEFRKPIWFIERFSSKERSKLINISEEVNRKIRESFEKLLYGDIDLFLSLNYSVMLMEWQILDVRDKHIAVNLSDSEEKLKQRYPELKNIDTLVFDVMVGGAHYPEKYINIPYAIIDLMGKPMTIPQKLGRASKDRLEAEEMRQYQLSAGVLKLAMEKKYPLSDQDIQKMDYQQLERIVSEIIKYK